MTVKKASERIGISRSKLYQLTRRHLDGKRSPRAVSNLVALKDARDQLIRYVYDSRDRINQTIYAD